MKMNWNDLLSSKRLGLDEHKNATMERTSFQIDYDRIVFSSAFRRLQDKTQVFPLAESDYVRTRLTHSMEVSCVARSLGIRIGLALCEKYKIEHTHPSDVGTILATAALAHDLGNPPFGHSGEDAIRHWFDVSPVMKQYLSDLTHAEQTDIQKFDGNAQGFRLLTVLQMPENPGGMQLSYATLGSFVKYPVESSQMRTDDTARKKKFNFFQSEKELMREVAEGTGLLPVPMEGYSWVRHPLVYAVEASDDICYRIVDFEDGFRLGLVSYEEVKSLFMEIIQSDEAEHHLARINDNHNRVEYLRAKAMQKLIDETTECFTGKEEELLEGKVDQSLIHYLPSGPVLKKLKKRAYEDVYSDKRVIEIEAAGFEVASGLLDLFMQSCMEMAIKKEKISPQSKKIMQIIPRQFHPQPGASVYQIVQNIIDYFSGMTDSYAVSLFKKLKGISLPGQ